MKMTHVSKDTALLGAGLIFGFVAFVHLLRLLFGFNLLIARHLIPVGASLPAFLVFLALTIWMFMAKASKTKR